jgi:hypothetical protein
MLGIHVKKYSFPPRPLSKTHPPPAPLGNHFFFSPFPLNCSFHSCMKNDYDDKYEARAERKASRILELLP